MLSAELQAYTVLNGLHIHFSFNNPWTVGVKFTTLEWMDFQCNRGQTLTHDTKNETNGIRNILFAKMFGFILSFLRTFCGQGCKLEFDGEVQDLFQYDCRYGYLVWSPFFLFSLIWLVFMLLYQYDCRYGYLVWSPFFPF